MNISLSKLPSDRTALLALKMSFPTENRRSTAALDETAVLYLMNRSIKVLTQKGDFSQNFLGTSIQPGLYQVLCLGLYRPMAIAFLGLSDAAEEVIILVVNASGAAALLNGLP